MIDTVFPQIQHSVFLLRIGMLVLSSEAVFFTRKGALLETLHIMQFQRLLLVVSAHQTEEVEI